MDLINKYSKPIEIIKDNMLLATKFILPICLFFIIITALFLTLDLKKMTYVMGSLYLATLIIWPIYGLDNHYKFGLDKIVATVILGTIAISMIYIVVSRWL